MIDAYASLPHYADHLALIWAKIPDRLRGRWFDHTATAAELNGRALTLVAGFRDVETILKVGKQRRLVYVEHGAGQTYTDSLDPAFSNGGASHPEQVVAYICPSWEVAERWHASTNRLAIAVGCPRLDAFHDAESNIGRRTSTPNVAFPAKPLVAVTFHWDNPLCPESRSAAAHYEPALEATIRAWAGRGASIVGHAHPRAAHSLERLWRRLGVPYEPDSRVILRDADLLVADNTSLLYEFAALDKPVAVLNAPWYRRHVHHGLRFWDRIPGVQIDTRDELRGFDPVAHVETDPYRETRRRIVGTVYAHTDGLASHRAAMFLAELHDGGFDG